MSNHLKKKSSSGFTITELLVATGLASMVFLIGSSVVTQLFSFQKDVDRRLMDNFSLVSFHRSLASDLQGAYWPRFDVFSCPSSQNLMTTLGTQTVNLAGNSSTIEYVTSDFSSTVGIMPGTDDLSVATMRNLAVGDFVLLSLTSSPSSAGLFKIRTVDRTRNLVELDTADLRSAGSQCEFSPGAKSLSDFFGPNVRSNVLLTRVAVVRYELKKGELTRQRLPSSTEEKIVDNVNSMTIKGTWHASSDNPDTRKQFGMMVFNITMDLNQPSLVGNNTKTRELQTIEAKFVLDSFQYMNRYATVGAPTASMKFPTCAVSYGFRPGMLRLNPGLSIYKNMVSITLAGYSSEKVDSASIDVSFNPLNADSDIMCFRHDPDNDGGVYPTNGSTINGPGIRGTVTMTQTSSNFQVYTCAVKGSVEMTAAMSYYDNNLSQVRSITCSADVIEAPIKYRFEGGKIPECDKDWGKILSMGSDIVSDDNSMSLGQFGIDMNKSCEWSGQEVANSAETGISSDCYTWNHWGRDLKRVYLRPYQMQVYNKAGTSTVFPATGASIECK